ncbi:MAG TPA: DUF4363 family protein [Firmicutes bacterium]|nr:DUF4363 family protein [Bacillota bacterium]
MKRTSSMIVLLVIVIAVVQLHLSIINKFITEVDETADSVSEVLNSSAEDRELLLSCMYKIGELLEKNKVWLGMSIDSNISDDIDISWTKCVGYLENDDINEFKIEFYALEDLFDQLSGNEKLSLDELL